MKCTKSGCGQEISYSEKLSAHIIVKGLVDPEIQEKVLALAATSEDDLDMKKITEVVYAHETGSRSRKMLGEADGSLNRMSLYKKNKRQFDKNEKCTYCGKPGHGKYAPIEIRKKVCSAFDNRCDICKIRGHIPSQCKHNASANALEEESSQSGTEEDSDAELGEFGFFAMNWKETANNQKSRDSRKIPHHTMNKSGKWKVSKVESQPEVTVDVTLCKSGYKKAGAAAPRMSSPRTVTCTSLPDTGSQVVVAGPELV